MKRTLIALFVSAALLAGAPATVFAQPQAAPSAATASPSKLVLDNSTRILSTLEARRAEFRNDRGALRDFIAGEFDNMFDRTYAARLVLGEGGEPIPVDYLMRKTGSEWKVFDVMVEGVSFVQTFRNQFDGPLSRQSIPEVAAQLEAGKLQAGTN